MNKPKKYIVIRIDNDNTYDIKYYSSLREIQDATGIHYSSISRYLRKKIYKSIGNKNPGRKAEDQEINSKFIIEKLIT